MKSIYLFPIILLIGLKVQAQEIIFFDDFETGVFGPNWVAAAGTPNGVVSINTGIGVSGTRGVRMGKTSATGGFVTNRLDLRVNLGSLGPNPNIAMTFDIQDRSDETQAEDGIYFSDNAGDNFVKVFDFNPSLWCDDNYGTFPPFDIDALAEANGLVLNNDFVIRFQQFGDNTLPGNDGFYLDNVSIFRQTIEYVDQFPFLDDFDATSTLSNAWTRSFPGSTNTLLADPNRPNNIINIGNAIGTGGSQGVRMGKDCSDGFSTNALDLHLDLSGNSDYALTFDIQDRSDETSNDDGLYFSNDGGTSFVKVFDFNPSLWCDDNYGTFPPLDIDELAAANGLSLSPRFVIRFQQHGSNTLPGNDGFYLDNVSVFVPTITYVAQYPFTDNFETGTLASHWRRSFPGETNTLVADPNRPNNLIEIGNFIGTGGGRSVRMGKDCADGFSTNALDLHLDLSSNTDYDLTFDIQDRSDETDADDGLYFSNDGGTSFVKVFDFNPSLWCDDNYGTFPPLDIDELAAANGLSLSPRFVIRFQQHGSNTLPGNDGFYLDNVSVFVPTITYVTQYPFTDNFETGILASHWRRSFPGFTNTLVADPDRPNNLIEVLNGIGTGSGRAVRMGKDCADGFSTNALDLHLDLSGLGQATLNFKLQDRNDETDIDDAVFFSNDGGLSFVKIYEFDFSNTPNVYTDYSLDLIALAAANSLSLTDQCIVRFQQHGDNTLPNNDGIYLDDVNVSAVVSTEDKPSLQSWQIYPNPTRDVLYLDIRNSAEFGDYNYEIRNLLGQRALSGASILGKEMIDVSSLEKGVYVIEIKEKRGSVYRQFVKL